MCRCWPAPSAASAESRVSRPPDRFIAGATAGAPAVARRVGATAAVLVLAAAGLTAAAASAAAATLAADTPSVGPTVELNRLEAAGGGCRLTLVVANPGAQRFEQLKLDLVVFDADGIVARRLAVETGPVWPNETVVRLFEAADLPCAGIGRLLLNDVAACIGEAGPLDGCLDRLATASRAAVPFDR